MRFLIYSIILSFLLGGALFTRRALSTNSGVHPAQSLQEPGSEPAKAQSGSEEKEQERPPERDYKEEMEDFVPSEKLPADSAISFPVDI